MTRYQYDYETGAQLCNTDCKVSAEKRREYVSRARWAFESLVSLNRMLTDLRAELRIREAEIRLLKKMIEE